MTKDTAQKAYTLVSLYSSLYKDKYKKNIIINKHREKWAMADVIDSVGFDKAKELLTYYFKIDRGSHSIDWFLYNFDKLDYMLTQIKDDAERRKKIMQATKLMVEEYDKENDEY